jgi:hypothetical protein
MTFKEINDLEIWKEKQTSISYALCPKQHIKIKYFSANEE